MQDSQIYGVSVRAWLSLITVASGLSFLYVAFFVMGESDVIITAVVGFIGLSLGYYLGQKNQTSGRPPQNGGI